MLRDQIFNNPGSMLAGCLIWIPIGIWVLSLVHWAVQGDMDVLSAFAGILVGIGLGMTALIAREPYMAPLILTAVVITMLAFPVVRSALNKRALDQIDMEAIERAYYVLSQNPTNAPAKFKLAKTIYNKGMPIQAIRIAESAIQQMPEAVFPEENRILKTWRGYRVPDGDGILHCTECGTANPAGEFYCGKCGSRFLLEHARGAWVGRALARKFVAAWTAIIVALVGIPFVGGSLPAGAAIPIIVGMMALAMFILFATFRTHGATT
jgi:hypothetical protein